MKDKFISEYEIVKMSRNSLLVRNKLTNNLAYIHRNVFNQLDRAIDYREIYAPINSESPRGPWDRWIEACIWKSI